MKYVLYVYLFFFLIASKGHGQDNTVFKENLIQAWQLHLKKEYEPATKAYVSAFKNYTQVQLDYGIQPEFKKVAKQLETIFKKDQAIRVKYVKKNYPEGSIKRDDLIAEMNAIDAQNLSAVEAILEKHGWLGPDQVGYFGNKAFFFTLQHAELDKQLQYFEPTVDAVAKGYAEKYQLAYLIDRISLREKRLLVFGSECRKDADTALYFVAPTYGVSTLDDRRALVDLEPMAEYVKKYNLVWDAKAYEQALPELMKKLEF